MAPREGPRARPRRGAVQVPAVLGAGDAPACGHAPARPGDGALARVGGPRSGPDAGRRRPRALVGVRYAPGGSTTVAMTSPSATFLPSTSTIAENFQID